MASGQSGDLTSGSSEASQTFNVNASPKVKHDWYQTDSTVVVTILVKNMKQEDVQVMYGQQTLSVKLHFPDLSEVTLGFNLSYQIVPAQCLHKVLSSKIEIKLKKLEDLRWEKLECEAKTVQQASNSDGTTVQTHQSKNWDKLVVELTNSEDEKPQGEAALNALFQKIYGDGSDEVRRAMNKSFVESGGTVLSTVWKDVGQGTVEAKPPEGMEWRNWDQ